MKTYDKNKLMPFGARPILPPLEYDHPLSPEEIKPAFGSPVIYLGVNLTAYADSYLERVHHIKTDGGAPLPDLGGLLQNEKQYELQTNLTLLIEHDARLDQGKPALRLEEYIFEKYGVRLGRTTIRSRVVHARMALILGAQGLIDKLPNQAQSLAIYSLPRESWIPFLKTIRFSPETKISANKIRKDTEAYARKLKLPLRGEPVPERTESSPESMTQQLLLPLDDLNAGSPKVKGSSEPVVSAPPSQEKSQKALESKLLQCLRGVLPQELPRYVVKAAQQQHQQPEKILLHEIRKSLNPPKESDARLNRIWHLIEVTTPDLAKQIVNQGLRHILGPAEKRTKDRILNRKKSGNKLASR